jgi:hypothetical protein
MITNNYIPVSKRCDNNSLEAYCSNMKMKYNSKQYSKRFVFLEKKQRQKLLPRFSFNHELILF